MGGFHHPFIVQSITFFVNIKFLLKTFQILLKIFLSFLLYTAEYITKAVLSTIITGARALNGTFIIVAEKQHPNLLLYYYNFCIFVVFYIKAQKGKYILYRNIKLTVFYPAGIIHK